MTTLPSRSFDFGPKDVSRCSTGSLASRKRNSGLCSTRSLATIAPPAHRFLLRPKRCDCLSCPGCSSSRKGTAKRKEREIAPLCCGQHHSGRKIARSERQQQIQEGYGRLWPLDPRAEGLRQIQHSMFWGFEQQASFTNVSFNERCGEL